MPEEDSRRSYKGNWREPQDPPPNSNGRMDALTIAVVSIAAGVLLAAFVAALVQIAQKVSP